MVMHPVLWSSDTLMSQLNYTMEIEKLLTVTVLINVEIT